MPEGNRRTPVDITLNFLECSSSNVDGYHIYSIYVAGSEYKELPLDANVRLPSVKSFPYKEMVKTLEQTPSNFFLQNSGISVIASDVRVDTSNKKIKLTFRPDTGIVNGGHTQLAILDTKDIRDISAARVKLEILKHDFNPEQLAIIAASKNTASNVKPYSTAEKKGYFTRLKGLMLDQFEKHIIWYENREVPYDRGMSAIDLIALLNLFNVLKFQSSFNPSSSDQPNKSATSKTAVFNEWQDGQEEYFHTYPLINDIISLHEHILSTFDNKAARGFTQLNVIKNVQGKNQKTMFTGDEVRFELPKQFLLPMLASLRSNIKYDDVSKKIGWYEKPEDVFDRCKGDITKDLISTYRAAYHNEINRASKDSNLWRILFANVDQKVNKSLEWKMYNAEG